MEEKPIPELSEEALDGVTGGVQVKENEKTGKYDLYSAQGKYVASYDSKEAADDAAFKYHLRHEFKH